MDIQAKIQAGKGKGYEQWAKVFNLKEAEKTLNFLIDHGVEDYEGLTVRADAAGRKFDSLSARIKQLEGRMAETAQLKMHTINYAKTRDIYMEYKKSGYSEGYRARHPDRDGSMGCWNQQRITCNTAWIRNRAAVQLQRNHFVHLPGWGGLRFWYYTGFFLRSETLL